MNDGRKRIRVWIEKNLEIAQKNDYITENQRETICDKWGVLLSDMDNDLSEESVIGRGNGIVKEMNQMVNDNRLEKLMSVDDFLNMMYEQQSETLAASDIMETFHVMLDAKRYDMVISYISGVDAKRCSGSKLASLKIATNPIDPLLRPIPKKESILEYMTRRCEIFDAMIESVEDPEMKKFIKCTSPDKYDYHQDRFVKDSDGDVHVFETEDLAVESLNKWYKPHEIDPEYRRTKANLVRE